MKRTAIAILTLLLPAVVSCGRGARDLSPETGDWPQYRADAGRTGYTPEVLTADLTLRWKREMPAPSPAWRGVHTRMTFDYASQPVVGGTTIYFGSSVDCKLYAVDTSDGTERWSYFTGAPVRFAPALWRDRVFVVSDDGYLYCLSASKGKLLWKKSGFPDDGMVIGNGRMIARHPFRGGPVIKDNVLYAGAGIWPSEGIAIYALDPESGRELWVNGDSGGMEYDQPHPGARSKSGVSSQGYFAAAGGVLLVPTGRSVPAAFDLTTGEFKYFHLQKHRTYGGSRVIATDDCFFSVSGNTRFDWEVIGHNNAVFTTADGELATSSEFNSPGMTITPDYVFSIDSRTRKLNAIPRKTLLTKRILVNAKGDSTIFSDISVPAWSIDTREPESIAMIAAGNAVISGSVNKKVVIMDTATKSVIWSATVDGTPYGLAVAHGQLFVATDTGALYCFDAGGAKNAGTLARQTDNAPYGANEAASQAAAEIIAKTGITSGWCLDLGCGDGALSFELAKRTNCSIIAIEKDAKQAAAARKKLDAAGIYGSRVTVIQGDPAKTPFPPDFANLIVSGRSLKSGAAAVNAEEASRMQRPYGGVVCLGKPGTMECSVREGLPGAGQWTHLYGDPGNTTNSGDEIVEGELGMFWFRDSDYEMPSRHGRGVAPLVSEGRMFVQGTHGIRAYDVYNGNVLWEYFVEDLMKDYDQEHLNGAAITNGNWCLEGDRLYVRVSRQMASDTFRNCLVIDTATGNLVGSYLVPATPDGKRGYWGYIAVKNGTLFGTVVNDEHITKWGYLESDMSNLFSESKAFFALDAATGDLKWLYTAKHSIRHNTIAIGDDRVYLIDRPIYAPDNLFYGGGRGPSGKTGTLPHQTGKLVMLDSGTGAVLKTSDSDIYGTLLALDSPDRVLVMTYQYTRFKLPSEKGGRMTGFDADTLAKLWDIPTNARDGGGYSYSSRPIINDGLIYLEPSAYNSKTGAKTDFAMTRSYNCGIMTGAKHVMLFRSGTMGYLDFSSPESGTANYGGIRPGCWINTIAAGGVVLMPDATARCNCSYLIKATVALQPMKSRETLALNQR